jgi:hypothetical protein
MYRPVALASVSLLSNLVLAPLARADLFPCSEQGIRDAITLGGGPHTFACAGPTSVVTASQIDIDNDVILDGGGNLTVDGNGTHRVFLVDTGVIVELRGLTVTGGNEGWGGGILNTATLAIRNSTISGNTASAGGGIFNGFGRTLTLTDSLVSGNVSTGTGASDGGGGIYNNTAGSVTLTNSAVSGNLAERRGGGIFNFLNGTVSLTDSVVSENQLLSADIDGTEGGGGIYHGGGNLTLSRSSVARNSAYASTGSGLMTLGGTVSVTDSTLSENAGNFGISGQGGGIFNGGAAVALTNTTFSGNAAYDVGNAIWSPSGTVTLTNCTVADNGYAGWPTSAISGPGVTLANTLVANPPMANCSGAVATGGGNLESPGDTCGLTDPSDQVNVSAGELALGPLADNGGGTQTHALLDGSFAIDAAILASCPLTDQRGEPRPEPGGTACDVGAFEAPEPDAALLLAFGVGTLLLLRRIG